MSEKWWNILICKEKEKKIYFQLWNQDSFDFYSSKDHLNQLSKLNAN